jgi:hypothetical protein
MRRDHCLCKVKVLGPRNLAEAVVNHLEEEFNATRTSGFRENDEDDGVHIFLAILESDGCRPLSRAG